MPRLLAVCPRTHVLIAGGHKTFISSPDPPDWLWGTTNHPFNKDRGQFLLGSSDQHVNLTTGIRVVLRVKMRGAAPPLPHVPEHFVQNNFAFTSFSETLPRDLTSR